MAGPAATSRASPVRRARSRARRRSRSSTPSATRSESSSRTWWSTRASLPSSTSTSRSPFPRHGSSKQDVEVKTAPVVQAHRDPARHQARIPQIHVDLSGVKVGMPACSTCTPRAVLPNVLREPGHAAQQRGLQHADLGGDVAGGRAVRVHRPLLPEQGHPGPCARAALPRPSRRAAATGSPRLHLLPVHHAHPESWLATRWTTPAAPSWQGHPTS